MTIEATGHVDFEADLAEWSTAMAAGTDAAVLEVAEFGRAKLIEVLSGSSSSRGGPPATSGQPDGLLESVTVIVLPSLTGTGVSTWSGTTKFYGPFLDRGFHPNRTGQRRSDSERKSFKKAARGAGLVRYPYIDAVFAAALARAASIADSIRML